MRLHVILRYAGLAILLNAIFLFISAFISALHSDSGLLPLLYSAMISTLFGLFPLIFVPPIKQISNNEGITIVVLSWLLSCLIGVLPYVLWGGEFSFTNAWFESVSGYTTTGASVLTDVEALPMGLLFWRSATHWIGGMGIIIFVLSVLPYLGGAGTVLYRSEMSSLAIESFHPRASKAVQIVLIVYIGLTVLETIALILCGMNVFDATTHAFATIATGGFSTKNLSIAYYDNVAIEMVINLFMILSGIHFALLFALVSGVSFKIFRSTVVRYYVLSMALGITVIAIAVHAQVIPSWFQAFRYAAFQLLSVGTSTGFATADTNIWPDLAKILLIFFTLQCACAGSTSGGIKTDRMVILYKVVAQQLRKMQHPNAVIPLRIDGEIVEDQTICAAVTYISVYLLVVFVSALLLVVLGVDNLSAFTGSAAAMGNVGPGLGIVGSMDNYSTIPTAGKWILSMTMLLGRLEIYGLLLFFVPKQWK